MVGDIGDIEKVAVAEIPEGLVEAQATYGGAAGREFIAGLPALAGRFLARWELRRTGPGMHGVAALVLPVERSDGTPAALKLQPVDEETVGEPVALRAWDGDGAVRLWEHDAASGAMLLERLDERRPLTAVAERDPREAVAVVAGLLARLTATPAPAEVAGEPGDRLLHWDLHYGNVLGGGAGGREEWLAIDPKPLAGDAGFELLPALVNNFAAGEVRWRFDLLAEVVGLDRERARAWTLGRVLQNCLWEVQDGEERLPHEQRAVAELLMGRDV
ncbi:aminoglycoside phosphotransferase family protein [Streptomyces sp. NPDC058613]|uniref:aminoglycoside phosphotransferase family protein n=1 Tax=Streptomyces sp. NPDC058613 TaxID=3346556 RepID=UPI003666ED7D